MSDKVIELKSPFEMFGKTTTSLRIKEPRGGLYARLGDPRLPVTNPSAGTIYFVENPEIIAKYLDALIDHDGGGEVVNMLALEDAMAVKNGLLSFFVEAELKLAAKLPISSPSSSA